MVILAKEFEGELWIKATQHSQEVKRAIEAEREACAELVSDLGDAEDDGEFFRVLKDAAIAIRARGRSEALTNLNEAAENMGQEL
jgi:hypothetical protein